MYRRRREGTASIDRLPVTSIDAGRGLGTVGALLLGGAVLTLAMLVGLTLTGSPAGAAFPGTNGKIACHGIMDRNLLPDPGDDDYEIYTINPDGSDMTYLTDNVVRGPDDPNTFFNDDIDPSYSPDGKTIAFTSQRSGGPEIYTMNADGTNVTRLTNAIGEDRANGWSPDGRTIYFNSARDGNIEIYKMNVDGSDQTRLTFNDVNDPATPVNDTIDVFPNASPDGRKIVFGSSRNGVDEELYTMNPDGSDVTRLTDSPSVDRSPNWSPDGKEIVWWSQRDFNPGSTTSRNPEIYKMNADGTGVTRLTDSANDPATPANEGNDLNPAWSPDGTKIVFNSSRSGDASEIYTMNADGSDVTRLTNAVSVDEFCDWQPIPIPAVVPPGAGPPPPVGGVPPTVARVRPNLFRPRGSARQPGRKIVVRISGRMAGNQGRSCAGRLKVGVRFAKSRRVTRTARLGANCRYSTRVAFPVRRLPLASRARNKPVILRVAVRFQGNAGLLSDVSPTRRIKVRR